MLERLKFRVRRLWQYLREVSGDDAYERYVAHHEIAHAGQQCLTRRQFFAQRQDEKWSKVSRCC
ncbi:MAG: YbdD/YjiX family protein [Burkholderiales bacterium]|jgi:uncharacterized short protein YbdD (DUF466 family)